MERQTFLNAQLWLQSLSSATADAVRELISQQPDQAHASYKQLLPPEQQQHSNTWCCFHIGTQQFCFFRSFEPHEDPTQMEFELFCVLRGIKPGYYVRFAKTWIYELVLDRIQHMIIPKEDHSASKSNENASTKASIPPPFGLLEFGSISMRVWLESSVTGGRSDAIRHIQRALVPLQRDVWHQRSQTAPHNTAQTTSQPSIARTKCWKAIFRHTTGPGDTSTKRTCISRKQFQQLLVSMDSNDDKEALDHVWKKIVSTAGTSVHRTDNQPPASTIQDDDLFGDEDDHVLTSTQTVQLVRALLEWSDAASDRDCIVDQLLQWTSHAECNVHDHCYRFVPRDYEPSEAEDEQQCLNARWHAWDEFLECSGDAFTAMKHQEHDQQARSSQLEGRTQEDDSKSFQLMQDAAQAFQQARVDAACSSVFADNLASIQTHVQKLEQTVFEAVYPMTGDLSVTTATPARKSPHKTPDTKAGRRASLSNGRKTKLEDVFTFLQQKRRQLVQDELALALLPSSTSVRLRG